MNLIGIDLILVPESRQRKEFSPQKLRELEESILSVGLLHPIVVRPGVPEAEGEARFPRLVAGERRLRTIQSMAERKVEFFCNGELVPLGLCPVTFTTDLDEIELKEAELDENIKRVDLTWQERAAALNELMTLRRTQNPEVTRREVATEVADATDRSTAAAETEILRAEMVSRMMHEPKVAAARSMKEAYNIASKLVEADFHAALFEATGESSSEHTLLQGDCSSIMQNLTPGTFDCIITDPPYGMGADTFGNAGPAHTYKDEKASALMIADNIFFEGAKLCKPEAHLYMFCDIGAFFQLCENAKACGWTVWRTPFIWDKGGASGHNPIPTQGIRRSYELILYAYRGDRPGIQFMSDVLRDIPPVTDGTHAAEKPAELYRRLLSRSCRPGESVLDPCCGTGPIFEAANALRLKATGIDLDETFVKLSRARMDKSLTPKVEEL